MIVPCALLLTVTLLPSGNLKAQESEGEYLLYLSDGKVLGYPKTMVKELSFDKNAECKLTLVNDSLLTWEAGVVDSVSQVYPSYPQITAMSFEKDLNDELMDDVDATIDGDKITATIATIGKYLTPTFETDTKEAIVSVNGVEQKSGESRLRFADVVTYTVGMPGHEQLSYVKTSDEVWSETGIITEKIALDKEMLSTNAPTSLEGEGLDMMLDGNTSTLFHSTWSKDEVYEVDLTKQVYLQVDLEKAISEFQFYYVGRTNSTKYNIQEWRIEASTDGTAWNEVKVINESEGLPVTGSGVTYTSPAIGLETPCKHLRFVATKVGYKNYLCLSEFSLYEVTGRRDESVLLKPATYAFEMTPMGREVKVDIDWLTERATSSVPRIDIDIEGGATVTSKDYYLKALVTIKGNGVWDDFQDSVQIKGRGNTSWRDFDKKPYRLKFAKSVKPFGLKKGKNWNLIAQAQTGSMMTNPVTMKIARLTDAAAANDVIPVELYMNGEYRGSYMFTQKVGLAGNSVDLEDESQAVLLELDRYYDETYKFKSANYALPVNIKDPDLSESETRLDFEQIQADFNQFETAVYNNANFERFLDLDKLVRFMLVNDLVLNAELGHPKSVYLYRENLNHLGSRYTFGPVWDFDWAYGYESGRDYFYNGATNELLQNFDTSRPGYKFFTAIRKSSPWIKYLYSQLWDDFMENHLQEVLDYIDDYYLFAKPSFEHNATVWSDGNDYAANAARMKQWLGQRANYLMGTVDGDYNEGMSVPYIYGDVTSDGAIDENDLNATLAYLMKEEQSAAFDTKQADIDANNVVSTSDLTWLCNQLSTPDETATLIDWESWEARAVENEKPISLETFWDNSKNVGTISVKLDNKVPYIACMMDINLNNAPLHIEEIVLGARTEGSHQMKGRYIGDNVYRVILYSTEGKAMTDTTGIIFNLPVQEVIAIGRQGNASTFEIGVNNVQFVTTNGAEVTLNDAQTTISFVTNGIDETTAYEAVFPADIYDIQGRLVCKDAQSLEGLSKGIYLVNRRKVVVK